MPRVTRAADHLSLDEAQQRRAQTSHPWHRRAWDVVYTALAAPRPAPRIAQQLGVSKDFVHQVISRYKRLGPDAFLGPGTGGRRRPKLPFWLPSRRKPRPVTSRPWPASTRRWKPSWATPSIAVHIANDAVECYASGQQPVCWLSLLGSIAKPGHEWADTLLQNGIVTIGERGQHTLWKLCRKPLPMHKRHRPIVSAVQQQRQV
jgi:hypothetical protein